MDLPGLTYVAEMVYEKFDHAKRFKWRFTDGPATFEAVFINELIEEDSEGRSYAPLIVTFIPREENDHRTWANIYQVHRSHGGMLYADYTLYGKYVGLRDILELGKSGRGEPFHPSKFLLHAQGESQTVPQNWRNHRIRTASDLPRIYLKDVEEADKTYFCGLQNNPEGTSQTPGNWQKTKRYFGEDIASQYHRHNISTKWTDDPTKSMPFPEGVYEV